MWNQDGTGVWDERDRNLSALGFAHYEDYLASDEWKIIRRRVLVRDKGKCKRCRKKGLQVHHEQYDVDTLLGLSLDRLHSLCGDCHCEIHGIEKPKKSKPRRVPAKKRKPSRRGLAAKRRKEFHAAIEGVYPDVLGHVRALEKLGVVRYSGKKYPVVRIVVPYAH